MESIPQILSHAALDARERLARLSRGTAASDLGSGAPAATGAMAATARQAIFADALLAAMHARLEALKSVAK
ncbi:MAG: hypothetical protein NVS2B3_02650 [Vulcanimicrobiaceae bacterium]